MLDYLNQFYTVFSMYIKWLFTLILLPGVSIGSILLVATLLWIISLFFPRH